MESAHVDFISHVKYLCDYLTLRLLISYIYIYIYIYVYDISSLRVNDLTLVLLMWRKW